VGRGPFRNCPAGFAGASCPRPREPAWQEPSVAAPPALAFAGVACTVAPLKAGRRASGEGRGPVSRGVSLFKHPSVPTFPLRAVPPPLGGGCARLHARDRPKLEQPDTRPSEIRRTTIEPNGPDAAVVTQRPQDLRLPIRPGFQWSVIL